jgi:hypothetical protein
MRRVLTTQEHSCVSEFCMTQLIIIFETSRPTQLSVVSRQLRNTKHETEDRRSYRSDILVLVMIAHSVLQLLYYYKVKIEDAPSKARTVLRG